MQDSTRTSGEQSLRLILDSQRRIPPGRAIDITARAAEALDALHAHEQARGSIRPDTVLISGDGRVRIDAPAMAGETTATSTEELDPADTREVAYYSPEQAQALEIDHRSDLYSLGVVLFEMLSGAVPFQQSSAVATAYKHASEQPARLDEAHPEIPPLLADIVDKALAKDPDDRYQSGAEMAGALDEVSGQLAPTDAPVSTISDAVTESSPATSPKGRHWQRVAMASVILLVAGISTAGLLPMLPASDLSSRTQSAADLELGRSNERIVTTTVGGNSIVEDRATIPEPDPDESSPSRDTTPPNPRTAPLPTTTTPAVTTTSASPGTTSTASTSTTQASTTTVPASTTTTPTSTTTVPDTTTTVPDPTTTTTTTAP